MHLKFGSYLSNLLCFFIIFFIYYLLNTYALVKVDFTNPTYLNFFLLLLRYTRIILYTICLISFHNNTNTMFEHIVSTILLLIIGFIFIRTIYSIHQQTLVSIYDFFYDFFMQDEAFTGSLLLALLLSSTKKFAVK